MPAAANEQRDDDQLKKWGHEVWCLRILKSRRLQLLWVLRRAPSTGLLLMRG
jgi:hypothetical protein